MQQSLIFLSPKQFHENIQNLVRTQYPSMHVYCAESLADVMLLNGETISHSRLISFLNDVIVPKFIIDKLQFGAINIHPGPPNYPGHAPFSFALYDGVNEHGITIHEMLEKVDSGKILALRPFPVPPKCDQMQLINLCIAHGLNLLAQELPKLLGKESFHFPGAKWGKHKTTKAEFASMCHIDQGMNENELNRRLAAFGDGDGITAPYIQKNGSRYSYQSNISPAHPQTITLYGKVFAKTEK
jgi:methionyl-tRNA formyltransferase